MTGGGEGDPARFAAPRWVSKAPPKELQKQHMGRPRGRRVQRLEAEPQQVPGGHAGPRGKPGRAVGLQEVGRGQGSCLPRMLLGRGWCPSHGTPGLNRVLGGTSAVGRNSQRQLDASEKENSGACKISRADISRTRRETLRNTPAHGGGAMSLFPAVSPVTDAQEVPVSPG